MGKAKGKTTGKEYLQGTDGGGEVAESESGTRGDASGAGKIKWSRLDFDIETGSGEIKGFLFAKFDNEQFVEFWRAEDFAYDVAHTYEVTDVAEVNEPEAVEWLKKERMCGSGTVTLSLAFVGPNGEVRGGRIGESKEWAFKSAPKKDDRLESGKFELTGQYVVFKESNALKRAEPLQLDFDTLVFNLWVNGSKRAGGFRVFSEGGVWYDAWQMAPADFDATIRLEFLDRVQGTQGEGDAIFVAKKLYPTSVSSFSCTHKIVYGDDGSLVGYLKVARSDWAINSITWWVKEAASSYGGGFAINRSRPLQITKLTPSTIISNPTGTWYSAVTPRKS